MPTLIFDMDGVIVLTGPHHYRAWRDTAAADGIDLSYDFFTHTFGRTNPDTIRMIWGPNVEPDRAAQIAENKEQAFRESVRADIPIAPGLHDILNAFGSRGWTLAVGSSAPRENLDLILTGAGIRPYFSAIVDGSMVSRGKPAPDVFLLAAHLARAEPAHCAVIEDAPAGIRAATSAGMAAIAVATTHPAADLLEAGAHHVAQELKDLTYDTVASLISPTRE
jgi:beta-phosphoglucomutase